MIIRHLKIRNFRGIKNLDWHPSGRVLCLIGPNDATKTTILDAIELALMPRSNWQITDSDFHNCDISVPITIEVTIGEVSQELLSEPEKFGLYLRGYKASQPILDDPADDCEPVLAIQFSADAALEPVWSVIKDNHAEPKRIGWQDRERLGLTRLGDDVEKHLTWGRGSALSKLTGRSKSTNQTFTEIARAARHIVASSKMEDLEEAANKAVAKGEWLGGNFGQLKPGLDPLGFGIGHSVLGLHRDGVPVRLWGLGSKRILAIGAQQAELGERSILMIDEIEHGLEPHRLRHILGILSSDSDGRPRSRGQLFFSSHSPTAAMTLSVDTIRFVRSRGGNTSVEKVDPTCQDKLQGIARTHGTAFFGRKILVCEGATEVGVCRALEDYWASVHAGKHPTLFGFVAIDGKGRTEAPAVALELRRVGYDAALLADTDEPLEPDISVLRSKGVPLFLWDANLSIEQRLFADLPLDALQKAIDIAIDAHGAEAIRAHVKHFGVVSQLPSTNLISSWIGETLPEEKLRSALGKAAKKGRVGGREGWFKNVTMGAHLGEVLVEALGTMSATPTKSVLDNLAVWIYAE